MKNMNKPATGIYITPPEVRSEQIEESRTVLHFESVLYVLKSVYPAECVLKAAYAFLDKAYMHIDENETCWVVEIEARSGKETSECCLQKDFENELIAQTVRLSVFKRTHTLREMMLARAMSSSLIEGDDTFSQVDVEEENAADDQLQHILKDWYEQHEE